MLNYDSILHFQCGVFLTVATNLCIFLAICAILMTSTRAVEQGSDIGD